MKQTRFYIYLHMNEDKTIAYIGKGSYNRAYSYSDRSRQWKEVFGKKPHSIEFLERDLTEEQALEREKYFIEKYSQMGITLLNKDTGGSGDSGMKHQKKSCKTLGELLESKEGIPES